MLASPYSIWLSKKHLVINHEIFHYCGNESANSFSLVYESLVLVKDGVKSLRSIKKWDDVV